MLIYVYKDNINVIRALDYDTNEFLEKIFGNTGENGIVALQTHLNYLCVLYQNNQLGLISLVEVSSFSTIVIISTAA